MDLEDDPRRINRLAKKHKPKSPFYQYLMHFTSSFTLFVQENKKISL